MVAPIAAGPTPEEEVQALGADVAEGDGLGSRSWLKQFYCELEPLKA